jgi:hypothetical protein
VCPRTHKASVPPNMPPTLGSASPSHQGRDPWDLVHHADSGLPVGRRSDDLNRGNDLMGHGPVTLPEGPLR